MQQSTFNYIQNKSKVQQSTLNHNRIYEIIFILHRNIPTVQQSVSGLINGLK